MKRNRPLFLLLAFILLSNRLVAQYLPPPRNLQFDSLTLIASWEPPRITVLDEHFEGVDFPPPLWQDTTQGMGWFATTEGSSAGLTIPPHTTYAVVNNDLAGAGNNGCCDNLVTPEMDLTKANGYTLSFNSFFRGWDAETASVEISTDGGNTWMLLTDVLPHFAWATLTIDLSFISGPGGAQHTKIAFKANDNGNADATGWAIDDVVVMSDDMEVNGYGIFLDGTEFGQTGDTTVTFQPGWFPSGFPPYFCISAIYDSGWSDFVCADFPIFYLAPPTFLEAVANITTTGGAVILTWQPPIPGDYAISGSTPRKGPLNPNIDYSPEVALYTGTRNSEAQWDELFVYQNNALPEAGVETDGNYIYTSVWNAETFYKYDLAGNLVESFTIPGVSSVRDLAYDGQYFYGSAANSVLFKMDFTTKALVSAINTGVLTGIRHIAYDADLDGGNGGFWCGDWMHLSSIKMNGSIIQEVDSFNLLMCYGSAVDPVYKKIWFHDQGGIGINIWEFDIATLSFTGFMYEPSTLTGFTPYFGVAGGLAYTDKVVEGKWVLLGVVQQGPDLIYGLDMGDVIPAIPDSVSNYYIYRDTEFIAAVPATETEYWDLNLAPGTYSYSVSAVYDLTQYGFPGQVGESQLEGPSFADLYMYKILPFMEDWTTGQFDVNQWNVGDNWLMDEANGNPAPAAKFSSLPKLTNYSSNLDSYYLLTGSGKTATPNCIWLDFDYLLDDNSASGTEKMTIEIADGDTWTTVKELSNTGDVNWTKEHLNITTLVWNKDFRIRFRMNGLDSEMINSWLIDNISVYHEYNFAPSAGLTAVNTGNTQQNDIQVTWDMPQFENLLDLVQDDSTWENSLAINPGYTGWLGNKFTTGAGWLRSIDIMWLNNANSNNNWLILDIFDVGHNLIGSSDAFVPFPGSWQTVTMSDLAFEGDFYAMVRFDGQSGINDFLGMDSTTSSVRPNNGWFYDGDTWSQMNAFGYAECVFSIRATIRLLGDCCMGDEPSSNSGKSLRANQITKKVGKDLMKSANSNSGLVEFKVFRREYQVPVPGQDSLLTEWQNIAVVSTNTYLDQNLDFKCYQYYSQAMYDEGSSQPSNTDEECFLVGMPEQEAAGVKLYPNPANKTVNLEFPSEIKSLSIIHATGQTIYKTDITNQPIISINTSFYLSGIYSIRFTTTKGDSFIRKLVVVH